MPLPISIPKTPEQLPLDSLLALTRAVMWIGDQFSVDWGLSQAIGTILSALNNRLGRIVDRRRVLEDRVRKAPAAGEQADPEDVAELELLARRISLIYHAIVLAIVCGLFVCMLVASVFLGVFVTVDLARLVGTKKPGNKVVLEIRRDDEIVSLKGLMHGRRLMQPPHHRLEIVDRQYGEGERRAIHGRGRSCGRRQARRVCAA